MRKMLYPFYLLLLVALPGLGQVQSTKPADVADGFTPDADKVLRYGKGYRYPQQGWIVVHVEGEPYERGYQQGRLLAPEIEAHVRCFATFWNHKAPAESWKTVRMFTNALFLRKYHQEYLEEMKGIADGASAAPSLLERTSTRSMPSRGKRRQTIGKKPRSTYKQRVVSR